jgi:hypothetical protein
MDTTPSHLREVSSRDRRCESVNDGARAGRILGSGGIGTPSDTYASGTCPKGSMKSPALIAQEGQPMGVILTGLWHAIVVNPLKAVKAMVGRKK